MYRDLFRRQLRECISLRPLRFYTENFCLIFACTWALGNCLCTRIESGRLAEQRLVPQRLQEQRQAVRLAAQGQALRLAEQPFPYVAPLIRSRVGILSVDNRAGPRFLHTHLNTLLSESCSRDAQDSSGARGPRWPPCGRTGASNPAEFGTASHMKPSRLLPLKLAELFARIRSAWEGPSGLAMTCQ